MLLWLLSACAPDPLADLVLVGGDAPDLPIAGLDEGWLDRFAEGDARFELAHREAQGLGPVYIRDACAGCHVDAGAGPGVVRKMAADDPDLLPWGFTERPYVAGGGETPLLAPDDPGVRVTVRSPPAVFGRGYLEAVDEATITALADAQAAAGRVSGRPNVVYCGDVALPAVDFPRCPAGETRIGRFGRKARIATLDGFAADAYLGDMSLTTPGRPDELANPDGLTDDLLPGVDLPIEVVDQTADYVRLIALPTRPPVDPEAEALFAAVGCADCHVPSLPTRADWPVPQLAGVEARVYTDLLLHDLGPEADDGQVEGEATGAEWRTAPLIGLRFLPGLMRDGLSLTVEDAISRHGGEAEASAAAFEELSEEERSLLLAYVEEL